MKRWGFALLFLVYSAAPASAETVPVELTFVPATGDVNRFNIDITATYFISVNDSDTAEVTGNALADLDIDFSTPSTDVADVTGLEFTGGQFALSDISLSFGFGFGGSVFINSNDIVGTLDTPSPPGSVVDQIEPFGEYEFPVEEHEVWIDGGTFDLTADGLIGLIIDDMSFDMGEEPINASTEETGFLVVELVETVDLISTYGVEMTLPVDFSGQVYYDEENGITVDLAVSGTLLAAGEFTLCWRPGDADHDGDVDEADASILSENWLSTGADWSMGDFNDDGLVNDTDAVLLAANWHVGVDGPAAVPEPSTAAGLLALALAALTAYRRCR